MTEPILRLEGVQVSYRGAGLGVQGLDLEVAPGEIVAMLGANGAGKTTTLRAVSGFLPGEVARLSAGKVYFKGRSVGHQAPHKRTRAGMGIVPEREKVFRLLTVEENLKVCASSRRGHDAAQTMALIYELFPPLHERRGVSAGFLSGGERQMLAIGRALMTGPDLLLADEISLGIAPGLVVQLLDTLRRINQEQNTAILLVEQNAAAALRVADRAYVLEHGRVVLDGTPKELLGREDFFSAYFGLTEESAEVGDAPLTSSPYPEGASHEL
ncbi:ABC transporter ATP-binding protein [Microbacterium sp. KHB019]|uniref:ABC transporter ATP-binding protein n=1 Tax=Microbacterium sp. KHB019 TaxID=3129770 RepID=UPI003078D38F